MESRLARVRGTIACKPYNSPLAGNSMACGGSPGFALPAGVRRVRLGGGWPRFPSNPWSPGWSPGQRDSPIGESSRSWMVASWEAQPEGARSVNRPVDDAAATASGLGPASPARVKREQRRPGRKNQPGYARYGYATPQRFPALVGRGKLEFLSANRG